MYAGRWGVNNSRMVADRLDDDEKGVSQIDTLGGKQNMIVINEPGLYNVILRSDKPEAKPFRKWVTAEGLIGTLDDVEDMADVG